MFTWYTHIMLSKTQTLMAEPYNVTRDKEREGVTVPSGAPNFSNTEEK